MLVDILFAMDAGDLSMLTLLDLSAAFDTVDHRIHHTRLKISYGVEDVALCWFTSYLDGRRHCVRRGMSISTPSVVMSRVPQGWVLGPILFMLYTADLQQLRRGSRLRPHESTRSTGYAQRRTRRHSIRRCPTDSVQ